MKKKRHDKILEIIKENEIDTQGELAQMLRESGFNVTQATVSRDIRELGLVKVAVAGTGGTSSGTASRHLTGRRTCS